MKAANYELELSAIRTVCAGKPAGLALLNNLTVQSFHFPTSQLMYRRIMARLKHEGHVPAWDDIVNDPTIPPEKTQNAQRIVRTKNLKPMISEGKGLALFTSLDNYRKLRAAYELIKQAGEDIKQPTADIDAIIKRLKTGAIAIDVNQRGAPITVDGIRAPHVVDAFTNADARIKTGHKEFDERSGGIPQGAVFLMGADTGGFKSAEALEMAQSMAKRKKRVAFYSLEMTLPEVTQRQTASVLEVDGGQMIIDFINKLDKATTQKEIDKIKADNLVKATKLGEDYEAKSKTWSEFMHITCPADEVDISWVLQQAEMSDREVIFIDYVGLLGGLNGENQWQAMSNVVRQCKIWTNRTGKTVIILAQVRFVDGLPELKYSKAVLDHCNNFWAWSRLSVNGRTYLCVHQPKARGQPTYPFILRVLPEFYKICDLRDAMDEEVAKLAIEDMLMRKDPVKRYLVASQAGGNEDKGRRNIEVEDDVLLSNGGFAGGKSYDLTAYGDERPPWEEEDATRKKVRELGSRVTASSIAAKSQRQTRAIALSKLNGETTSLTREEASIQAEDVLARWEDAAAGHRINVATLTREILGLTNTKELLNQVKRIQGDAGARKRLSKQELEVHKAQVEVIKLATQTIKTKGREFVSEEDFYAKDDLTLAVERGEEPIASPRSLDRPWQNNAVAWADQPAITLPNSAKPKAKRWGVDPDNEVALQRYKRTLKAYDNDRGKKIAKRLVLWPPAKGRLGDYHYLDDVQLDSVVNIAERLAVKDLADVSLDDLVNDVSKYIELVGPGVSRVHNRKRKRVVMNDATYKAACKKLGLQYAA